MTRIKLLYVVRDVDRHGNVRFYFRKRGTEGKIRLPGLPGSNEFMAAYNACLKGQPLPQPPCTKPTLARPKSPTLDWLRAAWMESAEFKGLDSTTRRDKRSTIKCICDEPVAPGAKARVGSWPFAEMTSKAVRMLRDRKGEKPNTANKRLLVLRQIYAWAIDAEHFPGPNPALTVPKLTYVVGGHHTWTIDEVRQFEARHSVGTQARLAFALFVYTGQRISDIVQLGRQHIKDGRLRFTQAKNRRKAPVTVDVPLLPDLARILDASPTGDLTFLVHAHGKPWNKVSFSDRMRKWCDEAGLSHCTAHGIRKAAACAAAEGGATEMEMMAIFGWTTADMARIYTAKARRAKLADRSMHLLGDRPNAEGTNVSHFSIHKK